MYKSLVITSLIAVLVSAGSSMAHEKRHGAHMAQDVGWDSHDFLSGAYTIRQKSTGRYLDAYESSKRDFRLVTRPAQDNDTQVWILTSIEDDVYVIQQASSGRYLDAYESSKRDFGIVTRPAQDDDTQVWILKRLHNDVYTIQQASTGRFMDAYEKSRKDFRLVTRPAQKNKTQKWVLREY